MADPKIDPAVPVPPMYRAELAQALAPDLRRVLRMAFMKNRRRPLQVDGDAMEFSVSKARSLGLVEDLTGWPGGKPFPVVLTRRGFSLAEWLMFRGWPDGREPARRPTVRASHSRG